MRILAISHTCFTDVAQQLFVALRHRQQDDVELIVPETWTSDYDGKPLPQRLLPSVDFPVHFLPVAVPGHVWLHFYKRLPLERFRRFRPDIILSSQEPWSLSNLQAIWLSRRLGVPFVFQTNQNILKHYPPPFSWNEGLSFRTVKVALAYSEEARQVMIRKGLRRPSAVVPYGTDLSLFQPRPEGPLREELGLRHKLVIGYMGRFIPAKGLDTLVGAIAALRRRGGTPEVAALLVGAGPEEPRIRRMVTEAGLEEDVVFTGAVPPERAGAYMNCMDVLTLPSRTTRKWKEQFGRVLIEAMACGVPVVGSDSGQIPYLIRDTGGGLVFEEGNVADLTAKLTTLIEDAAQRRQLGEAGHQAVRGRYTYEAVARQLHTILADAVASRA